MTLYDNLLFFAKLYNVSTEYVDDLLKRVGLYDSKKPWLRNSLQV